MALCSVRPHRTKSKIQQGRTNASSTHSFRYPVRKLFETQQFQRLIQNEAVRSSNIPSHSFHTPHTPHHAPPHHTPPPQHLLYRKLSLLVAPSTLSNTVHLETISLSHNLPVHPRPLDRLHLHLHNARQAHILLQHQPALRDPSPKRLRHSPVHLREDLVYL